MALLPAEPRQRKQTLLLMALVIIGGWYASKVLFLDPRAVEIDTKEQQLETLESANRRSRALAARRDDLSKRMALFERQLRIFEEFIPESEEVPELLDAISREAQLTQVEMTRIRPRASEAGGGFYTKQTWDLGVIGEYHDVGRFLTRVASLPRIIKPTNVQVGPAPQSRATRGMEAPLEVSLRIETFVLGADTASASAGAASSG